MSNDQSMEIFDSWKHVFLAHLRVTGNISKSAAAAGVTRNGAMYAKKNDPEFRERWIEAIQTAIDDIEEAGRTTALQGNPTMIIFMLKHLRPSVYRERMQLDINSLEAEAKRYGLDVDDVLAELDLIMTGDALPPSSEAE